MDLAPSDISVLNSIVDNVGDPVKEVSSIGASEGNHDLIVFLVVGNYTKGIKELVFDHCYLGDT